LLPYLIFAMGWLTPWLAILFLCVLTLCTWRVYGSYSNRSSLPLRFTWDNVLAFCTIIAWVHMSGAGGVGCQSGDYVMHNGRLKDLVEYAWPVRYGENQNLVFYIGYYLPAAALGKWLGFAVAYKSMYYWTLLGVAIAFRWLASLSQLRWTILAALLLVFFGGLDIVGYWIGHFGKIVAAGLLETPEGNILDFWPTDPFNYVIGAYASNAFQLFWAPHQIIAGWIVGALLLNACLQANYRSAGFIYALLALWAPMVMLAAAPIFLMLLCGRGFKSFISAFSIESVIGGGAIVLLFLAFYFSGSAAVNPHAWLWDVISVSDKWKLLLLYYACSWGILAALLLPVVLTIAPIQRYCFAVLALALFLISFVWYGLYSDMMVRGSALLMFMLAVYAGRVLGLLLEQRRWLYATVLFTVLTVSGLSGFWNIIWAYGSYGYQEKPVRAPDHDAASQFVGPDQTFFLRHLAAH